MLRLPMARAYRLCVSLSGTELRVVASSAEFDRLLVDRHGEWRWRSGSVGAAPVDSQPTLRWESTGVPRTAILVGNAKKAPHNSDIEADKRLSRTTRSLVRLQLNASS
jgi:hypothetical protein